LSCMSILEVYKIDDQLSSEVVLTRSRLIFSVNVKETFLKLRLLI